MPGSIENPGPGIEAFFAEALEEVSTLNTNPINTPGESMPSGPRITVPVRAGGAFVAVSFEVEMKRASGAVGARVMLTGLATTHLSTTNVLGSIFGTVPYLPLRSTAVVWAPEGDLDLEVTYSIGSAGDPGYFRNRSLRATVLA